MLLRRELPCPPLPCTACLRSQKEQEKPSRHLRWKSHSSEPQQPGEDGGSLFLSEVHTFKKSLPYPGLGPRSGDAARSPADSMLPVWGLQSCVEINVEWGNETGNWLSRG